MRQADRTIVLPYTYPLADLEDGVNSNDEQLALARRSPDRLAMTSRISTPSKRNQPIPESHADGLRSVTLRDLIEWKGDGH
jgi:hypothetical protein